MRTYPRNSFERCVQILRWLNEEFDLFEEGALRLQLVDEISHGHVLGCVEEYKEKLILSLSKKGNPTRSTLIDSLIHEAAHVALWESGRGLLHGPEFWEVFGRMMDAYDHHGHEDSRSYYVD